MVSWLQVWLVGNFEWFYLVFGLASDCDNDLLNKQPNQTKYKVCFARFKIVQNFNRF